MKLPIFKITNPCIKCGCTEIKVMFCDGSGKATFNSSCCILRPEHIHRECKICYYTWEEAPLDSAKQSQTEVIKKAVETITKEKDSIKPKAKKS